MPILNEEAKTINVEADLMLLWIDPRLAIPEACRPIVESNPEWKRVVGFQVDIVKDIVWTPEISVRIKGMVVYC